MSNVLLACLVFVFFLVLFSLFGKRIKASLAVGWYVVALIILTGAIYPYALQPVTAFLGIETVSNFILFSSMFFLFYIILDLSIDQSALERKLHHAVSVKAMRRWFEHRGSNAEMKPYLVVVPCFNEIENIGDMAARLHALQQEMSLDFCLIDDGSTDDSRAQLEALLPHNYVSHDMNVGVSGVLATALLIAKKGGYKFLINCDGDGQHPVERIPDLIKVAEARECDLMIGSRFADQNFKKALRSTTPLRALGSLFIRTCIWLLFPGKGVADVTSGFRVYRHTSFGVLLDDLPDEYPEPETIAVLLGKGYTVCEFGLQMVPRRRGVSSLGGIKSVRYMYKVLFSLLGLRLRLFWHW